MNENHRRRGAAFVGLALILLAWIAGPAIALTSEVKPFNGIPTLFIDGKPASPILAAPYKPGPSDFNDFRAGGISIFDIYLRYPWTGPTTYDFSGVDAKLDAYLAIDPNSRFLPRVLLTPMKWFAQQYPDEISRRDDGSAAGMFPSQSAGNNPSFSSAHYRELSHQAMIAFISHLESKYGDHIIGYQVGNGFGGEWLPFNSFWEHAPNGDPPAKFGVEDYSPAALVAFRAWLTTKYKTDAALAAAWHDPNVTFATATEPNEKDRFTTPDGIFFDPAISMRCPDYFTFYNDSVASVLVENASWVKELTNRKKIVGSFYGYLWCNFPNLSAVHSGQLGLTKVLNSPDIDFICSPYTYDNKGIGGPNNSQTLPEAVALHGKMYFNEVDTETHLKQRQWRWGNSLNNPTNFDETKGLLIRDYTYALGKGNGLWWTDLMGGDYHDDQIIGLLKQLKQIDEKSVDADKRSNADIGVIMDESAFTYTGDGEPLWNALLTAQKQWEFGFIGAPWEPQLLSDISNPKLPDYKLYIFLNTFHVTPEQRDAIQAKLKKNHATAIFIYAAGYIGDQQNSVDSMQALTGIHIAADRSAGELHVDLSDDGKSPYIQGLGKLAYGTDVNVPAIVKNYDHQVYLKDPRDPSLKRDLPGFRISPRFYADDAQATVLGRLAGVNKPGLVVKPQDGWTSIYSSAPILPASLLRTIARQAGCQIYDDGGDVVVANRSYLGIYSPSGGARTIHLPGKLTVTDLLENKVLGENVDSFPLQLQPNQSVLFQLKPQAAALAQPDDPKMFYSFHASADQEPSADPDSPFWKDIPGVTMNHSVLGPGVPELSAEIRSRWTDANFYFLFLGHYQKLTLNPHPDTVKETPRLWNNDVFELYLGADFEHTNLYRELQMSPQAEWLDNNIDSTVRHPGFNGEDAWNSGMKIKARIDESNHHWFGEMQIPVSAIDTRPATTGNLLRINMYRQDTIPKRDVRGQSRNFLAWQPTGVWNPHHPEKFGTLKLVEMP